MENDHPACYMAVGGKQVYLPDVSSLKEDINLCY